MASEPEVWMVEAAHSLDADGWRMVERDAAQSEPSLGRIVPDIAREILAYRDGVAAGLEALPSWGGVFNDQDYHVSDEAYDYAQEHGLIDEDGRVLDFGREIARVLTEQREAHRG